MLRDLSGPDVRVAAVTASGHSRPRRRRAHYGVDGGWLVVGGFWLPLVALAAASRWATRRARRGLATASLAGFATVSAAWAGYLYCTGPGKRSLWSELLDELDLRGDEHVLDVGCGRGAVLVLAAKRLPSGRVVGADLWRRVDQTGNAPAAARSNVVREGLADRAGLVGADARRLPFRSGSFDVVVSNLAIHNIRAVEERRQALRESVRVLRRGGRLLIVDDGARHYAAVLEGAGCVDVVVRRLDWRTSFGIPGHRLELVEAHTPAPPAASGPHRPGSDR